VASGKSDSDWRRNVDAENHQLDFRTSADN